MKKQTFLFAFGIFFGATALHAQQITFSRIYYDLTTFTQSSSVVEAFDGGYMIAGETDYGGLIMKIDSAGNYLWSKKLSSYTVNFNSIIATYDSSYVLAGLTYSTLVSSSAFIVKLNSNGDTLWSRTITGSGSIQVRSIQQTIDSGYVLTGISVDTNSAFSMVFVAKLTSSGSLEWTNELTDGSNTNVYAIKQTPDSGYVMIGSTNPPASIDAILIKLSPAGSFSWSKRYSLSSFPQCFGNDLEVTDDGFLCYLSINQGFLMKTDFSGNILWSKSFPDGVYGSNMIRTSDSCYVFVSSSSVSKVDSLGNVLWEQDLVLLPIDVIESRDRGFLILGNGPSSPGTSAIGIVKTDSLGNGFNCTTANTVVSSPDSLQTIPDIFSSVAGGILTQINHVINIPGIVSDPGCIVIPWSVEENNPEINFTIHPNPATDKVLVETTVVNGYLEVNDISGKLLMTHAITSSKFEIDLSKFNSGMYFLTLYEKGQQVHRKIIKE